MDMGEWVSTGTGVLMIVGAMMAFWYVSKSTTRE
jgi:hypothetical protein